MKREAAIILLATAFAGFAATVIGPVTDVTGTGINGNILFEPVQSPWIDGTNTIWSSPGFSKITNGAFSISLVGGLYQVSTPSFSTNKPLIFVPVDSTATQTLAQAIAMATNGVSWTNTPFFQISSHILPGTNIFFVTNNAALTNEQIAINMITNGLGGGGGLTNVIVRPGIGTSITTNTTGSDYTVNSKATWGVPGNVNVCLYSNTANGHTYYTWLSGNNNSDGSTDGTLLQGVNIDASGSVNGPFSSTGTNTALYWDWEPHENFGVGDVVVLSIKAAVPNHGFQPMLYNQSYSTNWTLFQDAWTFSCDSMSFQFEKDPGNPLLQYLFSSNSASVKFPTNGTVIFNSGGDILNTIDASSTYHNLLNWDRVNSRERLGDSTVDIVCSGNLRFDNNSAIGVAGFQPWQPHHLITYLGGVGVGNNADPGAGNILATNTITAKGGFATMDMVANSPNTITFPSTTAKWTNTLGINIVLYIDNAGVTGTTTVKNNGQIFSTLTTNVTLLLKPGDFFSETYSAGTPVGRWEPQ